MSKGDQRRPPSPELTQQEFDRRWRLAFGMQDDQVPCERCGRDTRRLNRRCDKCIGREPVR